MQLPAVWQACTVAQNVFVFRYISCQINQKENKKVVSKHKKRDMIRVTDKH